MVHYACMLANVISVVASEFGCSNGNIFSVENSKFFLRCVITRATIIREEFFVLHVECNFLAVFKYSTHPDTIYGDTRIFTQMQELLSYLEYLLCLFKNRANKRIFI